MMALTAINIAYYQQLMAGARDAIAQSRLADYVAETRENWARGEAEGAQE
jgi:queuine tRNA-ribosyltransferase